MGNDQSCGGDEIKKIKMEVRKKGEGEDHYKAKIGRNFPFCSPALMEMRSGRSRGAGVVEPVRGPGLTGTPIVQGGNLGAHGTGHPVQL